MTADNMMEQICLENQQMKSLLTFMPAMVFAKDAGTGVYLACNQSFAEYCHKSSPEEVRGCTDFDIFDEVTAAHFTEDDQKALSMDEPHIFIEDVPDAGGNPRHFQTTKIKFTDESGRLCTLGLCVDVTVMSRAKSTETETRVKKQELGLRLALQEQLLEEEKSREQQDKMITALASDYRCVYHVDLDRDEAICYRSDPTDEEQAEQGAHFPFSERFTWYACHSVTEGYREGFL